MHCSNEIPMSIEGKSSFHQSVGVTPSRTFCGSSFASLIVLSRLVGDCTCSQSRSLGPLGASDASQHCIDVKTFELDARLDPCVAVQEPIDDLRADHVRDGREIWLGLSRPLELVDAEGGELGREVQKPAQPLTVSHEATFPPTRE